MRLQWVKFDAAIGSIRTELGACAPYGDGDEEWRVRRACSFGHEIRALSYVANYSAERFSSSLGVSANLPRRQELGPTAGPPPANVERLSRLEHLLCPHVTLKFTPLSNRSSSRRKLRSGQLENAWGRFPYPLFHNWLSFVYFRLLWYRYILVYFWFSFV